MIYPVHPKKSLGQHFLRYVVDSLDIAGLVRFDQSCFVRIETKLEGIDFNAFPPVAGVRRKSQAVVALPILIWLDCEWTSANG